MPPRVKVDEDLPREVAETLRTRGLDAVTVHEQGWQGVLDPDLWPRLQAERRWLLTADIRFADPRTYPPTEAGGTILFRLDRESKAGYVALAEALAAHVDIESLGPATVVITPAGIRI